MPTKIENLGIAPITLPRPWGKTIKEGQIGFLRLDPADVIALIGKANLSAELRMTFVALTAVPTNGFNALDPFDDERLPTVTTTDATPAVLWEQTLDDNTAYRFDALVIARRTDAADRGSFHRVCTVYRQAAGAATLQGAILVPTLDAESDAGMDVTWAVTGNKIQLQVTGVAAKTIVWNGKVTNILAST